MTDRAPVRITMGISAHALPLCKRSAGSSGTPHVYAFQSLCSAVAQPSQFGCAFLPWLHPVTLQICKRTNSLPPNFLLHPMSIEPGTGPEGPQELESHADRGVSLSLVHLPPGVRLLPYRSGGEDGKLQPSAPTGYGESRRPSWQSLLVCSTVHHHDREAMHEPSVCRCRGRSAVTCSHLLALVGHRLEDTSDQQQV